MCSLLLMFDQPPNITISFKVDQKCWVAIDYPRHGQESNSV